MNHKEKAGKAPAFQFYVQDFLMGTADFSAAEVGGYILLLCRQWDKGPLPDDDKKLCKIARVKRSSLIQIRSKFTKDGAGMIFNVRLEMVRQEQAEYRATQSKKGKSGADKRWHRDGTGIPQPMPGDSSSSSSSSSSSISSSKEDDERKKSPAPDYLKSKISGPYQGEKKALEILAAGLAADELWLEIVAKQQSKTIEEVKALIPIFKDHCITIKTGEKTEKDFAEHFMSWIRKQKNIAVNGKRSAAGFPDHWDEQFSKKLSGPELSKYWEHLRGLGLAPKRNRFQVITDWVPANQIQAHG